jgi:hypothetical protein
MEGALAPMCTKSLLNSTHFIKCNNHHKSQPCWRPATVAETQMASFFAISHHFVTNRADDSYIQFVKMQTCVVRVIVCASALKFSDVLAQ